MSWSIPKLLILVSLCTFLVACGQEEPEMNLEATVAAALSATQTAAPTATAVPPTATPTQAPTATAVPTSTLAPTSTPEATATTVAETGIIETELDSGNTLYELPESGFSFELSPEWAVIDLTAEELSDVLGAVVEQNESLSFLSTEYAQNLVASGIRFYAINTVPESLASGGPFTLNVVVEELPFGLTAERYANLAVGQLEQLFDLETAVEQTPVTVGGEASVRLVYPLEIVTALGVPVDIVNTQYIFVNEGRAYIVTASVLTELAEAYLEPVRAAAETFRFIESGE